MTATTRGTLLGGRVPYEQPVAGYRTGIEPVFLAASIPAAAGERVLEAGTGAGAATLCLARRVPGLRALGVERDEVSAELARRNAAGSPGIEIRTGAIETLQDVVPVHHAFANPPWHHPAGTSPAHARRRAALQAAAPDTVAIWVHALGRHLLPGGTLTLVLAARLMSEGNAALRRIGAVRRRMLIARPGREPRIVLLHAAKGSTGPDRDLPALILHGEGSRYSAEAEAVLRDAAALRWDG